MPGAVMRDPTPQWLTDPSVTDSTLTKAMRWAASIIGADSPTAQVMGLMTTLVPSAGKTGGLVEKVTEAIKGIKAYHGSPHDFDQFSMEKIGTGEGAQAYGHGLYFAEKEGTAQTYKFAGQPAYMNQNTAKVAQDAYKQAVASGADDTIAATRNIIWDQYKSASDPFEKARFQDAYNNVKALVGDVTPGRMYEVNIKADPDQFLDWDAPLSQQSEKVRERLKQTPFAPQEPEQWAGHEYYNRLGREVANKEGQYVQPAMGSAFPDRGWTATRTRSEASNALKEAGIPGVKYLDQGSRSSGEGSYNYVVFDDSIVDILKKYGLLLPTAGAGLSQQKETTR